MQSNCVNLPRRSLAIFSFTVHVVSGGLPRWVGTFSSARGDRNFGYLLSPSWDNRSFRVESRAGLGRSLDGQGTLRQHLLKNTTRIYHCERSRADLFSGSFPVEYLGKRIQHGARERSNSQSCNFAMTAHRVSVERPRSQISNDIYEEHKINS